MACIREWLSSNPGTEQLQQVFKELSGKDKGASKLLREKLDDIKRSKTQATIALEWADKAQALLALSKLNLADALAWQRDAAKAGAPLSKEPLSELKTRLVDRVRAIEDLQHRVQVQREAAVLLAQRIEVLSTKPWHDAQAVQELIGSDVANWLSEATTLTNDRDWPSVDVKFPSLLQASQAQLILVWDAFRGALAQTALAAEDVHAALPDVPVWADELRLARGLLLPSAKGSKNQIDPEIKAKATSLVHEALLKLEQEMAEGHGKAVGAASTALRSTLKEYGRFIDEKLENQAHGALTAAGDLEGWQRWRADQLREELVTKAEDLLNRPPGQAIGGRKMQETLRQLRDQWKLTDQGGVPNHVLWKRFDDACNEAYQVVEAWFEKIKAETTEHRIQRLALIDEVNAWSAANQMALDDDWKGFAHVLNQFDNRWRESGHVGEKIYAELHPLWKTAMNEAAAPLQSLQKQSLTARHAMIEEAKALGTEPVLRIDAIKALQQRWQAEAHRVPMDRRHDQKLWDSFRKPIDDAFQRKTAEREKAQSALNERDRVVLDASKALQAANAAGDAKAIRGAMAALDAALKGQAQALAVVACAVESSHEKTPVAPVALAQEATDSIENTTHSEILSPDNPDAMQQTTAENPPMPARKAVVAMRGDDRPGNNARSAPMPSGHKEGSRSGDREGGRDAGRGGLHETRSGAKTDDRGRRRDTPADRTGERLDAPRLGDAAFKAQREALEQAQLTLRRLAAQAHGEALTQLLNAWEKRDAGQMPTVQDFGSSVLPVVRSDWVKAISQRPSGDAKTAILRLELAAQTPTPADHLSALRLLQLQLLTRRNDPAPAQTWGKDTATVLSCTFEPDLAHRLQNVLKVLLGR